MTPFTADTRASNTSLFVPPDSPLSHLEVLTRSLGPDPDGRQQDESRGESATLGCSDHLLQKDQDDPTGESNPAADAAQGHSSSSRECDVSTQWVLMTSTEELEPHLKAQQQFRAFVIRQRNSHSRLSISQDLFQGVSLICGLSGHLKDVLKFFGSRDLEVEVAAPRLRFTPLSWPSWSTSMTGFECIYGLRFVELNHRGDPQRMYSLRQMVVYNKEETDLNLATWVFVAPPPSFLLSLSEGIGRKALASDSPFQVHVLLFGFAVSSWRPYLVHLTKEVHQHANTVLLATSTGKGPIHISECGELQRLKRLADEMLDTAISLSTTRDAVRRLIEGYTHYMTGVYTQQNAATRRGEDETHHQLTELLRELDWLLQQTEGLRQRLLGTSQLVSSLMALGNGLSLEGLAKEAREENAQIHELTKKSVQDATAVKVLTVMMLVYLPATVVSNFFSTSFVDTDNSPGSPRSLVVLSNWWIFVVVSVPLTIVTLYIWWVFTGLQTTGTFPWWWERIAKLHLRLFPTRSLPTDEESNVEPVSTTNSVEIDSEKRTLAS